MELDDWYMNELRAAIDNNIEYKESENLEEQSDPVYVFKFQKAMSMVQVQYFIVMHLINLQTN